MKVWLHQEQILNESWEPFFQDNKWLATAWCSWVLMWFKGQASEGSWVNGTWNSLKNTLALEWISYGISPYGSFQDMRGQCSKFWCSFQQEESQNCMICYYPFQPESVYDPRSLRKPEKQGSAISNLMTERPHSKKH